MRREDTQNSSQSTDRVQRHTRLPQVADHAFCSSMYEHEQLARQISDLTLRPVMHVRFGGFFSTKSVRKRHARSLCILQHNCGMLESIRDQIPGNQRSTKYQSECNGTSTSKGVHVGSKGLAGFEPREACTFHCILHRLETTV